MTFLFVLYHWRQWMIKFTVTLHNVAGRKKFQQVKSTVYIVCVLCCYVWKCFYNVWTLVIDMHLLLFTYQTYASKVAPHGGSSPTACDLCSFNVPLAPFNGQDFRNIKVFACSSWMHWNTNNKLLAGTTRNIFSWEIHLILSHVHVAFCVTGIISCKTIILELLIDSEVENEWLLQGRIATSHHNIFLGW